MNSARNTQAVWTALPVAFLITVYSATGSSAYGLAHTAAILATLVVTFGFVLASSRLAWVPLTRKTGLWRSAVVMMCAIIVATVAIAVALRSGGHAFASGLASAAAIVGLLFGWCHAALSLAAESKNSQQAP